MNQDSTKILLTNRSKVVSNKKMSFLESLYLPAIFKGLFITMGHFFTKKATIQYPEVKRPVSDIYRGMHVLKRDEGLKAKSIYTGKKSMRLFTRSTCYDVFIVAIAKLPVRKRQSFLQTGLCQVK